MVVNRQRRVRVALGPLRKFLRRVQRTVRLPDTELTVCLVSDAEMARLNRAFRGQRGPTDVLSFPANVTRTKQGGGATGRHGQTSTAEAQRAPGTPRPAGRQRGSSAASSTSTTFSTSYLGDIAISPKTARRNARCFARPLPQELRILVLHGVLHLMGYDHETDRGEMERLERRLRRRLGLS